MGSPLARSSLNSLDELAKTRSREGDLNLGHNKHSNGYGYHTPEDFSAATSMGQQEPNIKAKSADGRHNRSNS